jgi:tetratricopeptide (TPR) repeat protein
MADKLTQDETFELMKALDGNFNDDEFINDGLRYGEELRLKNEKEAAEYTQAIKRFPHNAELYYKRGGRYYSLKELDKALDDYNKAASLDPKKGKYLMGISSIYFRQGETEKADAYFQKALEADPDNAAQHYYAHALDIEGNTQDKEKAAAYYRKSVEHGDYMGLSQQALDLEEQT